MTVHITLEQFLNKPWISRGQEPVPFVYPYGVNTWWQKLWWRWTNQENWLAGEIKVGDWLEWEPEKPHAHCVLQVIGTAWNGTEWWLLTRSCEDGSQTMNTNHRVREACVPGWPRR